jgi:glycosyltransferase involved in cell wall biosynthesis
LKATEHPSTAQARDAEWQDWKENLCALPFWSEGDRRLLREDVLPHLYESLAASPPATRWTNGDFLGGNMLVAADGRVCLVDMEFAMRTHFFAEDAARFHALSEGARLRPELLESILPDPGPIWHLFFWLRQIQLETVGNTAEYLARIRPVRLTVIRRLAEHLSSRSLSGWSVPVTEVSHHLEDARWVPSTGHELRLSGWCHVFQPQQLRHVVAMEGERRCALTAPLPRPDVQLHFKGDPRALNTGFVLQLPPVGYGSVLTLAAITDDGALLPFQTVRMADLPWRGPAIAGYTNWAERYDPDPSGAEFGGGRREAGSVGEAQAKSCDAIRFSILLPVHNTPEKFLRECLESVQRQYHGNWELCVVDDASDLPHVYPLLAGAAANDKRVRLRQRETNGGIADATNDALAMAGGDYVVLLDHDDALRPHALAELARVIAQDPEVDAIYSDEDKITADGRRVVPFFKPDFSPEFLCGAMYIGHMLAVRTAIARAAGGFDPTYDGVQDYEFFLRITERTRRIVHLPRILYHWRQSPSSSALHGNIKGDMDQRQAEAVRAHLARICQPRRVLPLGGHRLLLVTDPSLRAPTVSVIIAPDADPLPDARMLRQHLATGGASINEVLTDGDHGVPSAERLQRLARGATGEVLVFLTFLPPGFPVGWLAELATLAALDDTGAVAPVMLTPGGRVFDAGWIVGLRTVAPLMRGFDPNTDGYNGSLCCNRETSATSGLCFAVRRDRYEKVGGIRTGFDAPLWAIDLCLRLETDGRYNRISAATRIVTPFPEQLREDLSPSWPGFAERWQERLDRPDPFFNPHFDAMTGDYRLAPISLPHFPLRAARRTALQIHIDAPENCVLTSRFLRMHGWCFAPGTKLRALRLILPDREVSGLYGTFRPDVRAAVPEAPDDHTGFELWTEVPPGRYPANLQFQDCEGAWHEAACLELQVPRWIRPAWFPGANAADLVAFQLGICPAHAPRAVTIQRLPAPRTPPEAWPRIAIVTPSFNQALFLEQTIKSVLAAKPPPAYVVQDGGSADNSVELIRRYADHLLAWESAPDHGQADAIARGFAKTAGGAGDLMAWINADDFYLPGALAFVADYFARHPGVDVLYGNRVLVDEKGREIRRWFLPPHDGDLLRLNDFIPQETLFWRRRIWEKVGGVDTSLQFAIDWDLLLRFQKAGARMAHVPCFLACFRVHPAQKTAAQMKTIGQREIDQLRERTFGRRMSSAEIEAHPILHSYLRRSAFIEFLGKFGIRA